MVDMLAVHKQALTSVSAEYHEFLSRYDLKKNRVYSFVEGKTDYSYYNHAIQSVFPEGWTFDLWHAGNKDKVTKLFKKFDWKRFSRNRIYFFVDRDLADFLGEKHPRSSNFYVTDNYSIENDIVNRASCKRILLEIFEFHVLPKDELDCILDLFEKQLAVFSKHIAEIMAWVLLWRRGGNKPCLNDIKMNHLFAFDKGKVIKRANPNGHRSVTSYLVNQVKMPVRGLAKRRNRNLKKLLKEEPKKYLRGKYEFWFLCNYLTSVYENSPAICPSLAGKNPPKMNVTFGQANAMKFAAPRTKLPTSLNRFLKRKLSKL